MGAGPCGPFGVRAIALSQPDRFATGASRYHSACASRFKAAGSQLECGRQRYDCLTQRRGER